MIDAQIPVRLYGKPHPRAVTPLQSPSCAMSLITFRIMDQRHTDKI